MRLAEEIGDPGDHHKGRGNEAKIVCQAGPRALEFARQWRSALAHRSACGVELCDPLAAQRAFHRIAHRRGIVWRREDAAIATNEFGIDERADVWRAAALAHANDIQRDTRER